MKNRETIRKWLDDSLSEEERAEFEHTEDYRFVSRLSDALQRFKAPVYPVEEELERLHAKQPLKEEQVASKTRWLMPLLKVAAVLLLVGGFSYWFVAEAPFSDQDIRVSSSDQTELLLPDASFVALNSQSHISYANEEWSKNREVFLEGEAYFEVKKGGHFAVITNVGKVSVLGTRFNVKDRARYFEVTCYEGKVAVEAQGKRIVLPAGQQLRIVNGEILEQAIAETSLPSWTKNISTFASVPVIEVLREFERQYEVTFQYDELDTTRLFTGSFTHEDRSVALKSITIPLGLKYRVDQDKIILME